MTDRSRSRLMWWLNPKFAVGVTGIVQDSGGAVLYLEHAFRRTYPWALPGGWITRGESPEQSLVRELREETGLDVTVERVLEASTFALPRLDVVYLCRATGGAIRGSVETPHWQWCTLDAPPPGADPYSIQLVQRCADRFPERFAAQRPAMPASGAAALAAPGGAA